MRVGAAVERWPLAAEFRIARGAKREAVVVTVTVADGTFEGRGECLPYARYGETPEATCALIEARFGRGDHEEAALLEDTGCAAANNALDCAVWDLRAQRAGQPVWALAGLPAPAPVVTAYTLSLAEPELMAAAAAEHRARRLLKLKLGDADVAVDIARLQAVRDAAPDSRLIVDANEGWTLAQLETFLPLAEAAGVALIEQPLAADADAALTGFESPVPLGADESVHRVADLERLRARYSVVNVKLDKTGGLSRALTLLDGARALEFDIMIGCMVATSLSMAPALLLAGSATFVDLDGPLLLARDREPGLTFRDDLIEWASPAFWGERRGP